MTDDMQTRIAHLSRRLEDGWQRLDAAERSGDRRFRDWEDFFIKLLKKYTDLCDEAEGRTANGASFRQSGMLQCV